ncbi:hypothetical protein Tco_1219518 [Tanacetum coccineum]
MSIVPNAKDYREKINRESEIYFCIYVSSKALACILCPNTHDHISHLVSSDTTRPLHHHASVVVAVVDSTAGSTGRTRAEHNQVSCKHPAMEHYKLLSCAQRHPGTYPSVMTVCTPSSLSPPV